MANPESTGGAYTPSNPAPGVGYQKAPGLAPHTAYEGEYGYGEIPPRAQTNGVGIAALICGILALLISWIPFVNIFGLVLGIAAIVCGVIGIRRKLVSHGPAAAGIILGALSTLISLGILIVSIMFVVTVQQEMENSGMSFEDIAVELESGKDPSVVIDEQAERIEQELNLSTE